MNYEFDLACAIAEYLEERGILTDVEVEFDRNDPDNRHSCDLYVAWEEDDDRQTFTVPNAHRIDLETIFDLWVREREATHADYLACLATA